MWVESIFGGFSDMSLYVIGTVPRAVDRGSVSVCSGVLAYSILAHT